jgi:hypothetical protein
MELIPTKDGSENCSGNYFLDKKKNGKKGEPLSKKLKTAE